VTGVQTCALPIYSAGESPNSAEANATVTCPVTSAPATIAATAQPGVLLPAWSPVANATGYNLYRATNTAGPFTLVAAGLASTSYADYSATSGQTYYYVVQALNSCGGSTNSSPTAITTLPLPQLSCGSHGSQLVLSWPAWAGLYDAYSATNLASPILWQPVPTTPQNSNGTFYLTLPATNSGPQFFRLRFP